MFISTEEYIQEQVHTEMNIVNQKTSLDKYVMQFDQVMDDFTSLLHCKDIVKKYGLSDQFLDLVNYKNRLSTLTHIDISGSSQEVVLGAIEGVIGDAWKAIVNFFESIWKKIKSLFGSSASSNAAKEDRFIAGLKAEMKNKFGETNHQKIATQKFTLLKFKETEKIHELFVTAANFIAAQPVNSNKDLTSVIPKQELKTYLGIDITGEGVDLLAPIQPEERTLKEAGFAGLADLAMLVRMANMKFYTAKIVKKIAAQEYEIRKLVDHLQIEYPSPSEMPDYEKVRLEQAKAYTKNFVKVGTRIIYMHGWLIGQMNRVTAAIKQMNA